MTAGHDGCYPYLNDLMDYFDQDYDIYGDVPDIVARFARVHDPAEVWATIADIRRFIKNHAADAEVAFERLFQPQVVISEWNKTVPEWLRWAEQVMLEHAPSLPASDGNPRGP